MPDVERLPRRSLAKAGWAFASAPSLVIFPVPMNLLINLLLAVYVMVALLMVLVILMQRPKSEGLGAAFGGGVTENIFGAQTTNVLVKFTAWLAGIFFALTFALSILYAHKSTADSAFRRELMKTQAAPQISPVPTAGAQPSPISSPVPGSGAGVLPQGSASPVSSSSPAAVSPTAVPVATTPKQKRRP
ncbi:MAG TPA: preprotein translocase subunit SecG [Candidatus Binatus sp.]|nr:preprotein translocase subunit SecG [Candidatus Binatus sp.]